MRHLRRTVLLALALALCAAPATPAHPPNDHARAAISPARGGGLTGGELQAEAWARGLSGSNAAFQGTCTTLAPGVLQGHGGDDGIARCTATPRSRLFVNFGSFCSDLGEGFKTEREQLACARAVSQEFLKELNVTVDNGDPINIVRPRFELFSPQRTIALPADNDFGVPAGTPLTFTAHGWGVVVHSLRPGRHTVTLEVVTPEFRGVFITIILKVVPDGHSNHRDHGDD
ncbi:hypothetical protein OJ998_10170 [Solirubrobacter taibaiensis]|nr:hypothetical protein [Solirubrobacter taibaiensis]